MGGSCATKYLHNMPFGVLCENWSLGLPFENDDLLAHKSVFQHHSKPGAVQVQGSVEEQGTLVRLCPLAKRLLDNVPERIDASLNEGEERVHGLPFDCSRKPVILPHNELARQNPRTDVLFGHDSRQTRWNLLSGAQPCTVPRFGVAVLTR